MDYIKAAPSFRPKPLENVTINVLSTIDLDEIYYHVITGRGDVVAFNNIKLTPSKDHDFVFTATYNMVPKVKIIVFYITSGGEMISDSEELAFDNEMRNFVSAKSSFK